MKTVADQFTKILAAAGVERIYSIVGDGLNGLTDAISEAVIKRGVSVVVIPGDVALKPAATAAPDGQRTYRPGLGGASHAS